jgi:hypothetical protein
MEVMSSLLAQPNRVEMVSPAGSPPTLLAR